MRIYRSNRAERLIDALAAVLREPLHDPLAAEHVVVQSRGMERWLSMQISQHLGIAANLSFPFPRHLIERAFDAVLGEPEESAAPFAREALVWSVAAILGERLTDPAFAEARAYIGSDDSGVMRLQLARRLAQAIDDYAVYRPELLLGWERGEEPADMQAELFRAVVARYGSFYQAARAQRFLRALRTRSGPIEGLPQRVCLFGIASLPPLYVTVLSALSAHVETHLFVLTPSSEFIEDARERRDGTYEGHPLIAALGKLGRDLQTILTPVEHVEPYDSLFEDPGHDTLLHALQSDMLWLRDRGGAALDAKKLPIARDDRSISIHACHSPMREIEVLHDQLCRLLEDEALEPHDIVVMAPDIEAYAPVIEAVFAHAAAGESSVRPYIPHSVAHRGLKPESAAFDALQAALDILSQRVTASAVLDLLSREPVYVHRGLVPEDLETLRGWVEQAGIHWGVDEHDRGEAGQPPLVEGTFRFGLERMLLGYALEGRGRTLFEGRLPLDAVQGTRAVLAGTFAELCEALFAERAAVRARHTVTEWAALIERLLALLVGDRDEHSAERVSIRSAFADLIAQASAAGFGEPIALRALLPALESALEARTAARGYLSRGVTFCQLVPMRSVPFKVVCLVGMGDDRFPSRRPVHGFDRMQRDQKPGDRIARDDDRHVFLEALLGAREHFIVTYVGRSAHDDREQPAAVVVTDLLDAVARGFVVMGDLAAVDTVRDPRRAIEQRLVVRHRLHPFSPHYFGRSDDARLFSYATSYATGARAISLSERETGWKGDPLFVPRPLVRAPLEELRLDDLIRWVTRPARTLLSSLGVSVEHDVVVISEREPTALGGLEAWDLRDELSRMLLEDPSLSDAVLIERVRARGIIPLGANGTLDVGELIAPMRGLVAAAVEYRRGEPLAPEPVDLMVDGVRIVGALRALWPLAQLDVSVSKEGKAFELKHFVRHVVLSTLRAQGRRYLPAQSAVVARRETGDMPYVVELSEIAEPQRILRDYVAFVREARRGNFAFEYSAASAYAEKLAESQDASAALERARVALKSSAKLYLRDEKLLWGDPVCVLEGERRAAFEDEALRILGPMIEHRREVDIAGRGGAS
jgi:exodeoxyribonuclease V gamma subunit